MAQPAVTAPIARATKPEHAASLVRAVELVLKPADLDALSLLGTGVALPLKAR